MRKLCTFVLAIVMMISLCACGGNSSSTIILTPSTTIITPSGTTSESSSIISSYETEDDAKDTSDVEKEYVNIGDDIQFGNYHDEVIQWRVLAKEGSKILVISEEGLDAQPYDEQELHEYHSVTWEDCSLRQWLNADFIESAFTKDEQNAILETEVTADENPEDADVNQGENTEDKVFLLSVQEANVYFATNEERQCKATDYAKKHVSDLWVNEETGCSDWLLRTISSNGIGSSFAPNAAIVTCYGGAGGSSDVDGIEMVRPAMWLDISYFENYDFSSIEKIGSSVSLNITDAVKVNDMYVALFSMETKNLDSENVYEKDSYLAVFDSDYNLLSLYDDSYFMTTGFGKLGVTAFGDNHILVKGLDELGACTQCFLINEDGSTDSYFNSGLYLTESIEGRTALQAFGDGYMIWCEREAGFDSNRYNFFLLNNDSDILYAFYTSDEGLKDSFTYLRNGMFYSNQSLVVGKANKYINLDEIAEAIDDDYVEIIGGDDYIHLNGYSIFRGLNHTAFVDENGNIYNAGNLLNAGYKNLILYDGKAMFINDNELIMYDIQAGTKSIYAGQYADSFSGYSVIDGYLILELIGKDSKTYHSVVDNNFNDITEPSLNEVTDILKDVDEKERVFSAGTDIDPDESGYINTDEVEWMTEEGDCSGITDIDVESIKDELQKKITKDGCESYLQTTPFSEGMITTKDMVQDPSCWSKESGSWVQRNLLDEYHAMG